MTDDPKSSIDPLIEAALPGEARVVASARASLDGDRTGLARVTPFLGPAVIASVAYIDPGNFATNIAAGSQFGYMLLWVLLASNLMAMLIQSMSAKLGIATGMNLPEVSATRFSRPATMLLWIQAEVVAMATDLAEFLGAAIGLHLLFGMELLPAGVITGVAAFAILAMHRRGFRAMEIAITVFVGIIVASFTVQVLLANPDPHAVARGMLIPHLSGTTSLLLATGILGATVMPHVIYLHSALTQQRIIGRSDDERRRIFRFELVDVVIAMAIAGIANMAMLIMAAAFFHATSVNVGNGNLDLVFRQLGAHVHHGSDIFFGIALLASGLSSASVGTLAGQVVMQGYIKRQIPLFVRRAITMIPAFAVLAIGLDPSRALVISQVILSFGIPFALIPLVMFCASRQLMGPLVNRRSTTVAGVIVATVIVSLNAFLIISLLTG